MNDNVFKVGDIVETMNCEIGLKELPNRIRGTVNHAYDTIVKVDFHSPINYFGRISTTFYFRTDNVPMHIRKISLNSEEELE